MWGVELTSEEFHSLAGLVYDKTGIKLTDSKKALLTSRLQKRLRNLGLESFGAYYEFVLGHPQETEELINAITTNKTDFFREEVHFRYLRHTLIPALVAQGKTRLRVWCAAASTGEEPWTLAMTIYDSLPQPERWNVRILATDIDTAVLAKGRAGVYSLERIKQMEMGTLERHFQRTDEGYSVAPHLRGWVDFRQLNLTASQWPMNKTFDAVFCRNVMIYFDHQTKDKLVRRFARHVTPEGRLFVGLSEAVYWMPEVWKAVGPSIYEHSDVAREQPSKTEDFEPLESAPPKTTPKKSNRPRLPPGAESLPYTRIIVGQVEARAEPAVISTLLGSCVAIGLFDPVNRVGGLNHFLLPTAQDVSASRAASYGAYSIELLINAVLKLGGRRENLQAKIFGGGRVMHHLRSSTDIGASNLSFAKNFLEHDGIPIASVRAGGDAGLDVTFLTATGQAFVRAIPVTQLSSVTKLDQKHLERGIAKKPEPDDGVELF